MRGTSNGGILAILVLSSFAAPCASAQKPPTPFCNRSDVLAVLADRLEQAGRPLKLDAASIGEYSLGTDRRVHCAIRGRLPGFDTPQYGTQPLDATFTVHYALELRQNAIFLQLE